MKYFIFIVALILFSFALVRFFMKSNSNSKDSFSSQLTSTKFSSVIIDKGNQKLNVPVSADFVIYNTGGTDLYILKVEPDCRCTVAAFSKDPIHSKDSSIIVLKYDAHNPGPFQSSAVVRTNTSNSPTLLIFRGIVEP